MSDTLVDKIVSLFYQDTCWAPRKPNICRALGLSATERIMIQKISDVPTLTGNVSELYIELILPSVGDLDIMVHDSEHGGCSTTPHG